MTVVKPSLFGITNVFFCRSVLGVLWSPCTEFWTTVNLYVEWQAARLCSAVSHCLDKERLVFFLVCRFLQLLEPWAKQCEYLLLLTSYSLKRQKSVQERSGRPPILVGWANAHPWKQFRSRVTKYWDGGQMKVRKLSKSFLKAFVMLKIYGGAHAYTLGGGRWVKGAHNSRLWRVTVVWKPKLIMNAFGWQTCAALVNTIALLLNKGA